MSPPDRIRVAAAQYPLDALPTFSAWQDKLSAWVADGARTGARLLVFPEYGALELAAVQGTAVTADLRATLTAAADHAGVAQAHLTGLAAHHRVHILAPSGPVHSGSAIVNRACLITPAGAVGWQDKCIMTPFERDWGVSPGHGLQVFETVLGRIGIAICYDSEFPLLVRVLAEAGAEMVLIPSCTERQSGFSRVRTAAAARALESQIATVMSPTVGAADWCAAADMNTGAAGIFVPAEIGLSMTGILAEGRVDEPGWVACDIDLAGLRQIRRSGEMRNAGDWSRQPGAAPLARFAKVVALG